MTAETINARGEWVLVPRELLDEARNIAMEWTVKGRVPECGEFGQIAQDLDAMLAAAPQPAAARGDVPYDRELIARMLDVCGHPMFTLDAYREQARLLREAAQAKPEARGVVDGGSRSVTHQLLHWGGIPVHVTGTVTTSPGNWSLIDAALATQPGGAE